MTLTSWSLICDLTPVRFTYIHSKGAVPASLFVRAAPGSTYFNRGKAMKRRKPRRPVHYVVFAYRDGAVVGCHPERKPSARKLKEDGLKIDDDLVFWEISYGAGDFAAWELDQRVRTADLLSNRMNMRRTVRELIMPQLTSIEATLADVAKRLARVEAALAGAGAEKQAEKASGTE
jgi:hypothetical protein